MFWCTGILYISLVTAKLNFTRQLKLRHTILKMTRYAFASENQLRSMALLCQVFYLRIGTWLHLVLAHCQVSNSRCIFPSQDCSAGLRLPLGLMLPPSSSLTVLSHQQRDVFYNYSLSEQLQPEGTIQPFFPVISLVDALVFLVIRKVIAVISHAPWEYSLPPLNCNQFSKKRYKQFPAAAALLGNRNAPSEWISALRYFFWKSKDSCQETAQELLGMCQNSSWSYLSTVVTEVNDSLTCEAA